MRFLKTLFWIVVASLVTLFAARNWRDVTIELWSDLEADVKLPLLLVVVFLLGFVPPWLTFRAKLWRLTNRVAAAPREIPVIEPDSEEQE